MQLHELASSLFTHSIQILSRSSFFFTYVLYMTQNKGYQKYFAFNNGMKSDASAGWPEKWPSKHQVQILPSVDVGGTWDVHTCDDQWQKDV